MTREPGPINSTDVRLGDHVAYKDTAGIWHTRRASTRYPPPPEPIILLERPEPDHAAIIIDDGHLGADPETGSPEIEFGGALAIRVDNSDDGTPTYLICAAAPFTLDATDIATMRWHRVSIIDTEKGRMIADEYDCPPLDSLLLYAWGENSD